MKYKVEGIAALERELRKYARDQGEAFVRGLGGVARQIHADAVLNAPIDTGALRASGVWFIQGRGMSAVAYVGFGAEVEGYFKNGRPRIPAEYAVWQHDAPFEVRYLQNAVDDNFDDAAYLFWQELSL